MEYHKAIVPPAPADLTFEMVSRPLQLPAPFDLAKGIWPPALRWERKRRRREPYTATRRKRRDSHQQHRETANLAGSLWWWWWYWGGICFISWISEVIAMLGLLLLPHNKADTQCYRINKCCVYVSPNYDHTLNWYFSACPVMFLHFFDCPGWAWVCILHGWVEVYTQTMEQI